MFRESFWGHHFGDNRRVRALVHRQACVAHRPHNSLRIDRKKAGWYEQNLSRRRPGRARWPQTRQTYQVPRRVVYASGYFLRRQGISQEGTRFSGERKHSSDRPSRKGHFSKVIHEASFLAGSAKVIPRGGSEDEAGVARPPLRREHTRRILGDMSSRLGAGGPAGDRLERHDDL